jgi:hypothetical protein
MLSSGMENFTNELRCALSRLLNKIPFCFVPLRYLTTLLACSMCPVVAFDVYLASILVIVAISGRVPTS